MRTETRGRQTYDHRFRRLIQSTGDIQLAIRNGVPRSTANEWLRGPTRDVVTLDVTALKEEALQRQVVVVLSKNPNGRQVCLVVELRD